MFGGIATEAGQIAAIDLRQQPFRMQPPGGGDDRRISALVDLDSLLGAVEVKMDQRVEFIDQIGREGHGGSSLVETNSDDGAAF